jgi:hypothetical protein
MKTTRGDGGNAEGRDRPATGRNGNRASVEESENVEKIGRPKSDGSDTRDTSKAPALQGVSGSQGQE